MDLILYWHFTLVTEDLIYFMNSVTSEKNKFLTEDPPWAMDFAPNGMSYLLGLKV
jgi:gamma-glutamyltranspeptidase/glutathione hydrolase